MKRLFKIILVIVIALSSVATAFACTQTNTIIYVVDGEEKTTGSPNSYKKTSNWVSLWMPTASNKTFDGWYENENYTGRRATQIPANQTGDKKYYGRFVKDYYNVTYFIDGSEEIVSDAYDRYSLSYTSVELYQPAEEKDGLLFDGWYEKEDFTGAAGSQLSANVIGDKRYYGRYVEAENACNISYTVDGKLTTKRYLPSATNARTLWEPSLSPDLYKFDGWYTNAGFSGDKVTEIPAGDTGDKTYYARTLEPDGYSTGRVKAAGFTVKDKNGNEVSLASFASKKPVIVNFWYAACPNCKTEMPHFEKFYKEMGEDIEFMMVNGTDKSSDIDDYIAAGGYTFPSYLDQNFVATKLYTPAGYYPATAFVDRWGYLSGTVYIGGMLESAIKTRINYMTSGKIPPKE